jgi:hypothetical protein
VLRQAEALFTAAVSCGDQPANSQPIFVQSAGLYEQLRREGADNPELDHNLGNAYLLGGDMPRAILAYRRGLWRSPADRAMQEGLAFARSQVAYSSTSTLGHPPVESRPPWLPRLASAWYLSLALFAYSLGWLAGVRWWVLRHGRLLGIAGVSLAISLLVVIAMIAEERRDHDLFEHPVVVFAEDGVLLRSGNGLRYSPRYETPLNRGVEARLLFVRGDWLQIELAGGEIGWVMREYVVTDGTGVD